MQHRLNQQFILLQAVRNFFLNDNFLDVLTPPMVKNPGMETHIHPFNLRSSVSRSNTDYYLHTSPEFHMKELLSEGFEKIFTLSYCFRDELESEIHRPQFIMLEWYRANTNYFSIMDDIENLIKYSLSYLKQNNIQTLAHFNNLKFQRATIAEIFREILKIEILDFLDCESIRELIKDDFTDIPLPEEKLAWDDYFFLIFLNKIEPVLKNYPYLLLYEYPFHLSALSTLKKDDPRVCERFEVYLNGVELCNCFNELCNISEQKKRFENQAEEKQKLYNYKLSEPSVLYNALEKGIPPSAGVALGVERLLKSLTGIELPFWK